MLKPIDVRRDGVFLFTINPPFFGSSRQMLDFATLLALTGVAVNASAHTDNDALEEALVAAAEAYRELWG